MLRPRAHPALSRTQTAAGRPHPGLLRTRTALPRTHPDLSCPHPAARENAAIVAGLAATRRTG